MTPDTRWVQTGYELFAADGPRGIKVELVSKKVGVSKSSFYHNFKNPENFIDLILIEHIERVRTISVKEKNCNRIDPDLISILLAHKTDLLFHRQLRIHRHEERYARCMNRADSIVTPGFISVWRRDLRLSLPEKEWNRLLDLAIENFYMQLTDSTLTFAWLSEYFSSLRKTLVSLASPELLVR